MATTKIVLITGASRGLDLQLARHYVSNGWNVIAAARNPEIALKLKELSPWKLVQLDTSDEQSVLRAAAELASVPIDLLINHAGIFENVDVHTTTKVDLMHQFEINVTVGDQWLVLVQVSSCLGSIQLNSQEIFMPGSMYGYRASKAALNMITKSLTIDLRSDNIDFLLHPGYVATDMNPSNPEGAISVETSVAGMTKVISGFTLEDSGKFLDYEGNMLPW